MEWWNQASAAREAAAPPLLVRPGTASGACPQARRTWSAGIRRPTSWSPMPACHGSTRCSGARRPLGPGRQRQHNGTFVNERRITSATLADGDAIGFGDTTFRLTGHELTELAPAAPGAEAAAPGAPK